MKKELVSVVVPVYNVEKYIEKCINSLINQTYDDLEILLINDGSMDNSIDILNKYKKLDDRVIVIDRPNKGSIYTRLEGFRLSTGKYVMFVDSDDWLELVAIEKSLDVMKEYNTDIVKFNMIKEFVEENRKLRIEGAYKSIKYISKKDFDTTLYPIVLNTYKCNSMCAQLVRKDAVIKLDVNEFSISMGDDLFCNLEIITKINNIVFLPEFYYHYRYVNNSITTTISLEKLQSNLIDTYKVYTTFYKYIKIWNINTDENLNIVKNRVIKEVTFCLIPLVISKLKYKDKLKVTKYANQLIRNDINDINTKEFNLFIRLFLEKKYTLFLMFSFCKIKVLYQIKKMFKNILVVINK